MPLTHSKSDKAFEKNLKAELKAGKPKKQALAIAYSIQREAGGKPKKPSKTESLVREIEAVLGESGCATSSKYPAVTKRRILKVAGLLKKNRKLKI